MGWWPPIFVLQLLLIVSANEVDFGEMLGLSEFVLLTQHNCARISQLEIENKQCPGGLSEEEALGSFDQQCHNVKPETVRSHLIRDVHYKYAPRVLFVYVNNVTNQINYGIEKFSLKDNLGAWIVPKALKETSYTGVQLKYSESLEDSIFDTQSNILYLIIKASYSHVRRLQVVYISNIFRGRTEFKSLEQNFNLPLQNKDSHDWVENPYEHTVYYMNSNATHSVLYKLPMPELLQNLLDGTKGEYVTEMADARRYLIWVHKGGLITMARDDSGAKVEDVYYMRNATGEHRGRRCTVPAIPQLQHRTTRRLITVLEWDYCMLKQGLKNDGSACPFPNHNTELKDEGSNHTVCIVIIVLLSIFSLLMLVYVCWLRRSLDESFPRDEHKPVPYYPSGQPLDSTFDMSVDRWDQY